MTTDPASKPDEKDNLHPRNPHRERYDFAKLIKASPQLRPFVGVNKYQTETIDFTNPDAVIALNKALLKHFYNVEHWDIPEGYLCPPIPGRVDYIHYLADLLAAGNGGVIPTGNKVHGLDVGTGANCVYPIIGTRVYGWQFTASDIDPLAIRSANNIIAANANLKNNIVCRQQTNRDDIFKHIIKPGELFDLTMCNPPFHASWQEAQAASVKKWQKLNQTQAAKKLLNFGGKNNELWCTGGEAAFIKRMVTESAQFAGQVLWFTTLVSKKETLDGVYSVLAHTKAAEVKTINMAQGQKVSRVVAWTFLSPDEQNRWVNKRWR